MLTAANAEALRRWQELMSKQPEAVPLKQLGVAVLLCDRGLAVQGRSYYTRCLYEVRGAAHVDLKQYDLAYDDFSRAIALDPTIIDDRYYRGTILRDLGR